MTMTGSSSKEQSLIKPYSRERKNSISEINDNEDELLQYHRWQREERLREQEMEKMVCDQHSRYDVTVDIRVKRYFSMTGSNLGPANLEKFWGTLICSYQFLAI